MVPGVACSGLFHFNGFLTVIAKKTKRRRSDPFERRFIFYEAWIPVFKLKKLALL